MKKSVPIIFIIFILIAQGCIEEINDSSAGFNFNNSALILREIESRGDYINSPNFPASITAEELNSNLANYIVLDVRKAEDFSNGHIKDAVNITSGLLLDYIINSNNLNKDFVIISNTGQASSYYTALLRLYGLRNVYSLKFGMASWHKDFSHYFTDNIAELTNMENYHNVDNPKPNFSELPLLEKGNNLTAGELLNQRIIDFLIEGFNENALPYSITVNTIDKDYFASMINLNSSEYFIICSGKSDLYFVGQLGVFENPGHPKGAVLYKTFYPVSELSSVNYLQTIPVSKKIILYSYAGELSAIGTAHLRLLGYDAKSLLFGAHALFYQRLASSEAFINYTYHINLVKDFPYVK